MAETESTVVNGDVAPEDNPSLQEEDAAREGHEESTAESGAGSPPEASKEETEPDASEDAEKQGQRPEDIVIHGFGSFGECLSVSPFPIRVEIFLRWAKIPYQSTIAQPLHRQTKKTPWMEFKGQDYPDSAQIISFLCKEFNVDPDEHLTDEQRAVSRAFARMLSEATIFAGAAWRFVYSDNGKIMLDSFFNGTMKGKIFYHIAARQYRKNLWGQGLTRMPQEFVFDNVEKDIKACADLLGDKPYLMGAKVSSIDFLTFGLLQVVKHTMANTTGENTFQDFIDKFPKLNEYRMRLQEEFFPDWADLCKSTSRRTYVPQAVIET